MKLRKRAILLLAISILAGSLVGCGKTNPDVIAKVGNTEITREVLDNELESLESAMVQFYGEGYNDFESFKANNSYETEEEAKKAFENVLALYEEEKEAALTYLIENQVIFNKFDELNITITEEEILEELKVVRSSFSSEEEYQTALEQSGLTEEQLRENIKNAFRMQKLQKDLTKDVTVTDEEVSEYYKENIASYTQYPGAEVSHILVETEEEAKEILSKYNKGETFEDLAKEYGTDGTKDLGGSLGFIEYNSEEYDTDFMAGFKDLKAGEISEPVKTQFGWHLIKLGSVTNEEKVTPFEEVKEQVSASLLNTKQNEVIQAEIDKWVNEAKIIKFRY